MLRAPHRISLNERNDGRVAREARHSRNLFNEIHWSSIMDMKNIPFGLTDWSQLPVIEHQGEQGTAFLPFLEECAK